MRSNQVIDVRERLHPKRTYANCLHNLFQYPKVHGIEFTWEKLKKKLDLPDDCKQYNASGTVGTRSALTPINAIQYLIIFLVLKACCAKESWRIFNYVD